MRPCVVGMVLALCTSGCRGDGVPTADTFQVRDSAGIRIVENPRPSDGSRLGWTIGPEPAVSIGVLEGEEPYMLHWAVDATRLRDGRIVVANNGSNELRVFDAGGTHVATWGRDGEGPSDFAFLTRVDAWPGDSIVAWYTGAYGMAVYESDGSFGRTFVLQSRERHRPRSEAARPDGTLLSTRDVEDLDSAIVEIWTSVGALAVSLGAHPAEEILITGDEGPGRTLSRLAYSRQLVAGLWGDRVVVSHNSRYEIMAYRADGSLDRVVRRDHVLRSPTEADREPFVDEQLSLLEGADIPEFMVQAARHEFETTPMADFFPAFVSVLGDAASHLWIEEFESPRQDRPGTLWTLFDPKGRMLGFVETLDGLEIYEIGEDYILGRVTDELGVESIQLWPLDRSG